MKRLLVVLTLIALPAFGQVTNQAARRVVKFGTAPTTCTVGDIYYKTGASAGGYLCTAANTWSAIASGGVGSTISGSTATTPVFTVQTTDDSSAQPVFRAITSTSGTLFKVGKSGTGAATNMWVGPEGATFAYQTNSWIWTDGAMNFLGTLNNGASKWSSFSVYNEDNTTSGQYGVYSALNSTIAAGTKGSVNFAFGARAEQTSNGGTVTDLGSYEATLASNGATGTITRGYGLRINSASGGGALGTFYGVKIENQTIATTANYSIFTGTGIASFGDARVTITPQAMTAGTMTVANSAEVRQVTHRFNWTNAMITALGAVLAGDVTICTLPANTIVKNVYVVIDTPDTSANALTIAVGRVSAAYIDYIVASDAKAAANTVYGDASAERGTNLTGYDLPSITGTTAVKAHFIKTTTNLNTVTGSTGHIYITTEIVP